MSYRKELTRVTYKMIVLDLDDTLLRDDLTISNRTKQALMDAQEAGVKVVLASGRPSMRNAANCRGAAFKRVRKLHTRV